MHWKIIFARFAFFHIIIICKICLREDDFCRIKDQGSRISWSFENALDLEKKSLQRLPWVTEKVTAGYQVKCQENYVTKSKEWHSPRVPTAASGKRVGNPISTCILKHILRWNHGIPLASCFRGKTRSLRKITRPENHFMICNFAPTT